MLQTRYRYFHSFVVGNCPWVAVLKVGSQESEVRRYVCKFLRDSNINYQKYTLVFGFNYDDDTQKMWQLDELRARH